MSTFEALKNAGYDAVQFVEPATDGSQACEESDRWEQSLVLARIARESFMEAEAHGSHD